MNKRTIRKRFMRLDELALPAKEKMLPKEALREAENYKPKARIHFHRPATVALSIAAVIAIFSLVIVGVTSSAPKNIYTDISSVLDNQSAGDQSIYASADQGQSEDLKTNLPIVSCGKYNFSALNSINWRVPIGEVFVCAMSGANEDVNELHDNALYSVCFRATYSESTEYKEGINRINKERQEKRHQTIGKAIAYLEENEKETYDALLEDFKNRDKATIDDFYEYAFYYFTNVKYPATGAYRPEWVEKLDSEMIQIFEEYEKKIVEFRLSTIETVTAKMYEYLEGLGIEFYDKTVYTYISFSKDGPKEIISEEVYRVAFLTKDQIESLRGGEDYGILVMITCEELAKMDNEPVYITARATIS